MTVGTARRERLRRLADRKRRIPDKGFGLREFTVTLVQTLYNTPDRNYPTETPILNAGANPKVRFLTVKERAAAGLEEQTIEVGPITPEYDGGGYTPEQLCPLKGNELNGQYSFHYLVTGPGMGEDGSLFAIGEVKTDRPLGYYLILQLAQAGKPLREDG